MKKTVKLSVIVMCVVMILASCTAPIVPKNPALDGVGGTANGDGTITLEGSGVVLRKDGFIAGEVIPGGKIKNPDGSISTLDALEDKASYDLIAKAYNHFGGQQDDTEYNAKIKPITDGIELTEPHEFKDGIKYLAMKYVFTGEDNGGGNPDGEINVFLKFTDKSDSKIHVLIVKTGVMIFDGKSVDPGNLDIGGGNGENR